jgi:hypothetical protein
MTSIRILKTGALVFAALIFTVLLVGTHAKETTAPTPTPTRLGIEILSLKKLFYVPASDTTKIVMRASSDTYPLNISAVRLEPKMEGEKLRVTVSVLVGEPGDVRTCKDWDALKALPVESYLVAVDEEVTVTKLNEYGVRIGDNNSLTFRAVPRKPSRAITQDVPISGDCECGTCGESTTCCAYPGMCLGCGSCGLVCCSGSYSAALHINEPRIRFK